jgi:MFS superfamily sulfate permease-like transporter
MNKQDYDTNQELLAHGWSNLLSGIGLSVPNDLVYSNSVLCIRAGGNSVFYGPMLVVATGAIMIYGTQLVNYVPTILVISLMFYLGLELLREALIDVWHIPGQYPTQSATNEGRRLIARFQQGGMLGWPEYIIVVLIVIVMASVGFTYGILVGALLSCFVFVVNSSRLDVVSSSYAVTLDAKQEVYAQLASEWRSQSPSRHKDVDFKAIKYAPKCEIRVLALQSSLFFGNVHRVATAVKYCLHHSSRMSTRNASMSFSSDTAQSDVDAVPLPSYFIFDLENVGSIDYTALMELARLGRQIQNEGGFELCFSGLSPSALSKRSDEDDTLESGNRIQQQTRHSDTIKNSLLKVGIAHSEHVFDFTDLSSCADKFHLRSLSSDNDAERATSSLDDRLLFDSVSSATLWCLFSSMNR